MGSSPKTQPWPTLMPGGCLAATTPESSDSRVTTSGTLKSAQSLNITLWLNPTLLNMIALWLSTALNSESNGLDIQQHSTLHLFLQPCLSHNASNSQLVISSGCTAFFCLCALLFCFSRVWHWASPAVSRSFFHLRVFRPFRCLTCFKSIDHAP